MQVKLIRIRFVENTQDVQLFVTQNLRHISILPCPHSRGGARRRNHSLRHGEVNLQKL